MNAQEGDLNAASSIEPANHKPVYTANGEAACGKPCVEAGEGFVFGERCSHHD